MSATETSEMLTLRLPAKLHTAVAELARRRAQSVDALIQAQLETLVSAERKIEEEKARYEDYTLLGQDREATDVDYALLAQAEVMLNDDI